jgi:hypothetical protein
MRFVAGVMVAFAACSSRPLEPLAPIVGKVTVGDPWPVPIKGKPATVKLYTTLDGKPVPVVLLTMCGATIGGLLVERVFYRTGAERPILEPDAVEVADPVDEVMKLATQWLQAFERQGFVLQGQFGGSVDAILAMSKALVDKKARGEEVGPKDLPSQEIDRAQLERGDASFVVILKRGEITRILNAGNIMGKGKVNVSEEMTCLTGSTMVDFNAPEVVVR